MSLKLGISLAALAVALLVGISECENVPGRRWEVQRLGDNTTIVFSGAHKHADDDSWIFKKFCFFDKKTSPEICMEIGIESESENPLILVRRANDVNLEDFTRIGKRAQEYPSPNIEMKGYQKSDAKLKQSDKTDEVPRYKHSRVNIEKTRVVEKGETTRRSRFQVEESTEEKEPIKESSKSKINPAVEKQVNGTSEAESKQEATTEMVVFPDKKEEVVAGNYRAAKEVTDVEQSNTAKEMTDVEQTNTDKEVTDVEQTNTAEEVADVEQTNTAEEVTDVEQTNTAKEVTDVEQTNTAKAMTDVEQINTDKEVTDVEQTTTAKAMTDVEQTNTAKEVTDVEQTTTAEEELTSETFNVQMKQNGATEQETVNKPSGSQERKHGKAEEENIKLPRTDVYRFLIQENGTGEESNKSIGSSSTTLEQDRTDEEAKTTIDSSSTTPEQESTDEEVKTTNIDSSSTTLEQESTDEEAKTTIDSSSTTPEQESTDEEAKTTNIDSSSTTPEQDRTDEEAKTTIDSSSTTPEQESTAEEAKTTTIDSSSSTPEQDRTDEEAKTTTIDSSSNTPEQDRTAEGVITIGSSIVFLEQDGTAEESQTDGNSSARLEQDTTAEENTTIDSSSSALEQSTATGIIEITGSSESHREQRNKGGKKGKHGSGHSYRAHRGKYVVPMRRTRSPRLVRYGAYLIDGTADSLSEQNSTDVTASFEVVSDVKFNGTGNATDDSSYKLVRIPRASKSSMDSDIYFLNPPEASCQVRGGLKTAEMRCKMKPSSITCLAYCVYGSTFDDGIVRQYDCEYLVNKWSQPFEECKPYVDCKLKLTSPGFVRCTQNEVASNPYCEVTCYDYEEKEAVNKTVYKCKLDGSWEPSLPYCATTRGQMNLAKKPEGNLEHGELKYPK